MIERKYLFIVGVLLTGTVATLSLKLADVVRATGVDGTKRFYRHPYVQTFIMFIGEMFCLAALQSSNRSNNNNDSSNSSTQDMESTQTHNKRKKKKALPGSSIFAIPALCDLTSTCMLSTALTLTSVSAFQMLKGCVVVFVALFSTLFLKTKLKKAQIIGIAIVLAGTVFIGYISSQDNTDSSDNDDENKDNHRVMRYLQSVVGDISMSSSSMLGTGSEQDSSDDKGFNDALFGNILVVLAQVLTAGQIVVEESILSKYHEVDPLYVVGLEGCWGTVMLFFLLITVFSNIHASDSPQGKFESIDDAITQMCENYVVLSALLATMFSVPFLNFCGVSVTKNFSGTHRMIIDTLRTVFIWIISMSVGWESFDVYQFLGFVVLITGAAVFNQIIKLPFGLSE